MSLESRSNIKSWFRVCLWRIRHYDEPVIPRHFLLLLFLTFKNPIFTIKLSSNHLLKVNQIEQLPVGTILSYYFGKTAHLRFCSSVIIIVASFMNLWFSCLCACLWLVVSMLVVIFNIDFMHVHWYLCMFMSACSQLRLLTCLFMIFHFG